MNEIWALGLIDEAGYNGIKDKHIDKMARVVLDYNIDITNREELIYCCKKCGLAPKNFKDKDLPRLLKRIEELKKYRF